MKLCVLLLCFCLGGRSGGWLVSFLSIFVGGSHCVKALFSDIPKHYEEEMGGRWAYECLKIQVLLLFGYGEANRLGVICHREIACYSPFPRHQRNQESLHARPQEEAPGLVMRQKGYDRNVGRTFIVVSMKRKRWGRVYRLRVASLNNFIKFWGTGTMLVVRAGPGVVGLVDSEYEFESPTKQMLGGVLLDQLM